MLLGVTVAGHAQETTNLSPEISTWEQLKNVKDVFDKATEAETKISSINRQLTSINAELATTEKETMSETPVYVAQDEKKQLNDFFTAYDTESSEVISLYYKIEGSVLTISTKRKDGYDEVTTSNIMTTWTEEKIKSAGATRGISTVSVLYLDKNKVEQTINERRSPRTFDYEDILYMALDAIEKITESYYPSEPNPKYVELVKKQETLLTQLDNYNSALDAIGELKTISLLNNITIEESGFKFANFGSGYVFNGNGYKIIYPSTSASEVLFNQNGGVITNIGVENGAIAATNVGRIATSFETTNKSSYNIYDSNGTRTTNVLNQELGYSLRSAFGLSINEDGTFGTLDKKTPENIVYKAQYTDAKSKVQTNFYTNVVNGNLSYNPVKVKKNTFVYVQDTDIEATAFTNGKNIVVNGKCANAVLEDATSEADDDALFIPTGFTAVKLSYDRAFSATDMATVCLPFSLTATEYNALGIEKIMQFNDVDVNTNTYWFMYQSGTMAANEPYVLKFNGNKPSATDGKVFASLENKEISATGSKDLYAVTPSKQGAGAEFLGLYAATNASVLAPVSQYKLYGFSGGVFRPMATDTNCKAFRTYVRAAITGNPAQSKEFRIGLLDENGNVVEGGNTTGLDTVTGADTNSFNVKGGNNTINITADKSQKVNIYTVGGSLVKTATVEAGSTSIPVASGMYIVNGKKVVVK